MLETSSISLTTPPNSTSINHQFLVKRGQAVAYFVKTNVSAVHLFRLHPFDLSKTLEVLLRTRSEWGTNNEPIWTFHASDESLHLYSQEELELFTTLHQRLLDEGVIRRIEKTDLDQLENVRYYPGKALGGGIL